MEPQSALEWVVEVDPDIEDLVPGFLENRRKDVESLREAAAAADYGTVASIGHTLKGVGAAFGFDPVTDLGAELELAAKAVDGAAISEATSRLGHYLDHVRVVTG